MVVCVTGATGFVGKGIVEALLSSGHSVRALVRKSSFNKLAPHPNLTLVAGEALNAESVKMAVIGCDAIVHAVGARRAQVKATGLSYEEVDLGSAKAAICAMKATGCRRIVVVSAGAIGHSEYVVVKQKVERAIIEAGLDWTILRPSFIIGKGQLWPLLMGPILDLLALLPGRIGDVASRAGNVTLVTLANSIVWSLEHPESIGHVLEVPTIRKHGAS